MVDTLTPAERSARMGRIRGSNTKPELLLRLALHRLGYRYRLHRRDLPGRPDIVFPSRRRAIFVHGCFWHHHTCKIGHVPASRTEFWQQKFARNKQRDERNLQDLSGMGWEVLVIWECELKDVDGAVQRAAAFLDQRSGAHPK